MQALHHLVNRRRAPRRGTQPHRNTIASLWSDLRPLALCRSRHRDAENALIAYTGRPEACSPATDRPRVVSTTTGDRPLPGVVAADQEDLQQHGQAGRVVADPRLGQQRPGVVDDRDVWWPLAQSIPQYTPILRSSRHGSCCSRAGVEERAAHYWKRSGRPLCGTRPGQAPCCPSSAR